MVAIFEYVYSYSMAHYFSAAIFGYQYWTKLYQNLYPLSYLFTVSPWNICINLVIIPCHIPYISLQKSICSLYIIYYWFTLWWHRYYATSTMAKCLRIVCVFSNMKHQRWMRSCISLLHHNGPAMPCTHPWYNDAMKWKCFPCMCVCCLITSMLYMTKQALKTNEKDNRYAGHM